MSYADLLRDPRWQRKRLEVLDRDEFRCCLCGDDTSTLHVHHGYYEKGRKPWEYEAEALVTLCEGCHETVERQRRDVLAFMALSPQAYGFFAGYAAGIRVKYYGATFSPLTHEERLGFQEYTGLDADRIEALAERGEITKDDLGGEA